MATSVRPQTVSFTDRVLSGRVVPDQLLQLNDPLPELFVLNLELFVASLEIIGHGAGLVVGHCDRTHCVAAVEHGHRVIASSQSVPYVPFESVPKELSKGIVAPHRLPRARAVWSRNLRRRHLHRSIRGHSGESTQSLVGSVEQQRERERVSSKYDAFQRYCHPQSLALEMMKSKHSDVGSDRGAQPLPAVNVLEVPCVALTVAAIGSVVRIRISFKKQPLSPCSN